MPYKIVQHGNKFSVVAQNTGHVAGTHESKKKAQAQMDALYANESGLKKCMTCGCNMPGVDHIFVSHDVKPEIKKCVTCGCGMLGVDHDVIDSDVKKERGTVAGESSANSGRISGGVGWKIEFNTPDCQHGWSVIKVGSGQSIGCFFKEEDAKAALEALAVTEPIVKAEGGYKPTSGMKSAAAKAIKWKEEGKAKGAGTSVGWTRAHQIVSGESLSLDTVKRMYSFFSRHEVDKQGKEWDKPSHGKVMWYAWGGDAGYSWSRAIVEREKKIEKEIWAGTFSPTFNSVVEKKKDKYEEVISDRKGEPADKELYARVVAAAKQKFDVYPSAYANGWVVQEYKRRGGKYTIKKDEARKCMTCGCDDLGNDHHYISDTEKCMYCLNKGQGPCWDGYSYTGTKEQDGKTVPNCIPNKVKKDDASGQTNQNKQEGIGSFSFWNGAFGPVPGLQNGDAGWKSTYNTPPQKDGTPTVGYGNHSDPKGRSNQ